MSLPCSLARSLPAAAPKLQSSSAPKFELKTSTTARCK
jgi:hypothetical protein